MTRLLVLLLLLVTGCTPGSEVPPPPAVPDWAADAVWYQIFPERFANGDTTNDPDAASLDRRVPSSWSVTPWTSDWYARADWEREGSDDFYNTVRRRRYGGDLQGVLDRLDYLKRLGINAIYFNPLFQARSEHKYDGSSYHHIDPYFGPDPDGDLALIATETSDPDSWHWTSADSLFLVLVGRAHNRGIRIIMDGVFNHTGRDFFAFADLRERQAESPYRDWYIVESFDDPSTPEDEFDYKGWWGAASLPEFADTPDGTELHPGPRAYVYDATARWMDPDGDGDPRDGIDGWRLDVAGDMPIGFWTHWNRFVREINPDAYTVSEYWDESADFVRTGGFSATMNYHGFAFPVKGFLVDGRSASVDFAQALDTRRKAHDPAVAPAMQNLIDGHDTERLASMIVHAGRGLDYVEPDRFDYDWGDGVGPRRDPTYLVRAPNETERQIQRLVTLFQMTYVGAPMVYYGTEAGMWGADDPDDRQPMLWEDLVYDEQAGHPRGAVRTPDRVAFDPDLFDFYRSAIVLRKSHPSLRRGDFDWLAASDGAVAFARTLEDQQMVVVLNRSNSQRSVRVPLKLAPNQGLYAVLSTGEAPSIFRDDEAAVTVDMPPLTGTVLIRTGEE